ncbi:unnamed protein product [Hydatigera taeniaeformis]|uniref:PAT complex subunit CCDC47 n=1 Tax=Hydatigena taeniaeformis TaxID=6205 RepID=A0A3P7ELJ0_HYDTA|nr:unnamed protein product [Hydatigera taeniaeformis]
MDHYIFEMFFLAFILLYLVNYMHGRAANSRIAAAWFAAHEDLLSANFSLVGDDSSATPAGNEEKDTGKESEEKSASSKRLIRESDSLYTLWCSGRVACTGMMVELRLMKRQDLPSLLLYWLHRPKSGVSAASIASDDRVVVKVVLEDGEMDTWVMAVGVKRSITALTKDHFDLATYPVDRRGQRFSGLPEGMIVLSEIGEATAAILNQTVLKVINDHQSAIEYIYISDQYSGPKASMEDLKPPKPEDVQKVLIFSFICEKLGLDEKDVDGMRPLFNFVFYLIEKTRKLRLGKEAKAKSDRARAKVSETLLKSVQAARQEAAQNRRDEQRRAVKERIMTEEDPEKARRLEEREQKRENRKRQQRIKMVKMKGM